MRCPCRKIGDDRPYVDCCAPYHDGALAQSADALMRSRYSAFALERADYLLATWHPSTRPASIEFNPGRQWMLLRVLETHQTGDTATVAFIARSRVGGSTQKLQETSHFVRESGRWLYIEGLVK